jgi:hypothetical protein
MLQVSTAGSEQLEATFRKSILWLDASGSSNPFSPVDQQTMFGTLRETRSRWLSGLLDVDIVVGGYAPFVSRSHEDLL